MVELTDVEPEPSSGTELTGSVMACGAPALAVTLLAGGAFTGSSAPNVGKVGNAGLGLHI